MRTRASHPTSPGRSRVVIAWGGFLFSFAIGLAIYGPAVWHWATTEQVHHCRGWDSGWITLNRFTGKPDGEVRMWSISSGHLITAGWESGTRLQFTNFDREGRVFYQVRDGATRTEAPWWFGMADQTEPSAPWIEAGLSYNEWYESRYTNRCDCLSEEALRKR